jgi:hypothetical protein
MLVTVDDLVTYMDIRFSMRQEDAAQIVLAGLQSELEGYLRRPVEVEEFSENYVLPSNHLGVPMSSFFYNTALDTTMSPLTYSQPPGTIYLRNSPIVSVKSVYIRSMGSYGDYMAESLQRYATVTGAVQVGQNITYTAANDFTIGQLVAVTGMAPSGYNVVARKITAVTPTTFTVGQATTPLGSVTDATGSATARGNDYVVRRYGVDVYRGFANDHVDIVYTAGLDGPMVPAFKLLILRAATREMQNMHDDVVGIKDLNSRNVAPLDTGFTDRELASVKRYRRVRAS